MTQAYDIETVLEVADLPANYVAQLLLAEHPHACLASTLEAHAATAAADGRQADAARMMELARRLRR